MLFSTQLFILVFLPLTLAIYYYFATSYGGRLLALAFASLFFYAWWDPRFLPLLVGMISLNFVLVRLHAASGRRALLILAVVLNLAVLALFKYANFAAESVLELFGVEHQPWSLILPLGISFFTFQQISYVVDRYRARAPLYGFKEYCAYVSFFPQLIAGPIVRHDELIDQFKASPLSNTGCEFAARGLVLFALGLVKKVFLADELAPLSDEGFMSVAAGASLSFDEAWLSSLAFSLQLYFDFSAYSDMAIGLGAMFGLRLPINFNAPYRALNIREFWRRWHMTLSRFFRDYVYIPIGGSHGGLGLTFAAVIVTMLLCGLWHGAAWTFVVWGGLHGLAVCVNRIWSRIGFRLPIFIAWAVTMLFVIVGWVLFRAESFSNAASVLVSMTGFNGVSMSAVDADDVSYVLIGMLFAILGPTNLELSERPRLLRKRYAVLAAFTLFVVCLRVGQGRGLEFIYFQF